jgi:hypothetical protein
MTRIQITDLSSFDCQLGNELEELTDEELLAINGGDGVISDLMRIEAYKILLAAHLLDRATDKLADGIRKLF